MIIAGIVFADLVCAYYAGKMSIDAYGPTSQPLTFLDPELDK